MAGIGFRLRRVTEEEGIWGLLVGYSAAAAIMAGPWILTILTVGMVSLLGQHMERFEAYVVHIYQASLLLVGFLQFPATRHLADLMFKRDYRSVYPAFNATFLSGLCLSTLVGFVWAVSTPGPDPGVAEKLAVMGLLNVVSGQWIALIFLVTIHRYKTILGAFAAGGLISITFAVLSFGSSRTLLTLMGFTVGQLLTLVVLLAALMREFPAYDRFDFGYWGWIKRSFSLPLAGFLFYLGSFADKLVYRYAGFLTAKADSGDLILGPWLYLSYPYEVLTFWAQLTIIPALAIFYIKVETGFFEVYKAFYQTIDNRGTLEQLYYIRDRILDQLVTAARTVCASQGVITLLCILVAPDLFQFAVHTPSDVEILRAGILAAFFGILVLLMLVIFLYFEFYREACAVAGLYALLNGGLTILALQLRIQPEGWGAVVAALVVCSLSAWLLWTRVKDLLYQTFTKSPVKTLPLGHEGLTGVGKFHFRKEGLNFDSPT
jgi:polysaccharide biosynthesis protein PelG